MRMTATFTRTSGAPALKQRLQTLQRKAVYVGIPAGSTRDRQQSLLKMAGKLTGKSKASQTKRGVLERAAAKAITNAELLFIFSKGSPLRNQPARPVLEPAIEAKGNREPIAAELAAATKATLDGKTGEATRHLQRAGVAGANAARGWFTNPENQWQQSAPSTIRRKLDKLSGKKKKTALAQLDAATPASGSMPNVGQDVVLDALNTPGVDTGAMRAAISWFIKNDDGADGEHEVRPEIEESEEKTPIII